MSVEIKVSSKGPVVIPKDVRDAPGLVAGTTVRLSWERNLITLEAPEPARRSIDYDAFRRGTPRYQGQAVSVENMTSSNGELFRDWPI